MRSPRQTIPGWSGDREGVVFLRSVDFGCRLSLSSGTPVTSTDVVAATSLYYTEYQSNLVLLPYRAGKWEAFELPKGPSGVHEIRADFLANSPWALANATVYDVFVTLGQDGPKLVRGPAWSSATARAAALARHDGVFALGINPLWVYVGTIYASAANQCEDSVAKRFVWNMYNRVDRLLSKQVTDVHTYSTATWRQFNSVATNQIEYVCGAAEDCMTMLISGLVLGSGTNMQMSWANDATNTSSALNPWPCIYSPAVQEAVIEGNTQASSIGYHYIAAVEYGAAGGPTFYGYALSARWRC